MIRRPNFATWLGLFAAVVLLLGGTPASAAERPAGRGVDVSALHAAAGNRPVRVIVELRVGRKAGPKAIRAAQRAVVTDIFGAGPWSRRDLGEEPHSLSLMSITPAMALTVTPSELERLAAHPKVRSIAADGLSRPMGGGPARPN